MSTGTSANNKDVIALVYLIGRTPGFVIRDAKSGNFKAHRLAAEYGGHQVDEASQLISIRTKDTAKLKFNLREKLGWTNELYEAVVAIQDAHRKAETDPTEDLHKRLLEAFLPDRDTPAVIPRQETVEEARERVRHARTTAGAGSARRKAPQASTGMSTAPAQVLHGKGEIRAEYIGVERAVELLASVADYQRKVRKDKVDEFKGKMQRGEWVLLPSDPICIDTEGRLCNGQHRLEAIYQLEQGQEFYVAYDVEPDTYDKMDRGTKRTTADALYGQARQSNTLRNDISFGALSATLRQVYLWEEHPQEAWLNEGRKLSEDQVKDTLRRHPGVEDSVAEGRLTKLKVRPTASMFAHYMITMACDHDPTLVNAWYEELRSPKTIRPGDPAFALREYFLDGSLEKSLKRKSLGSRGEVVFLQTYLILRAWANTCDGTSMTRLSWKPDFKITLAARPTDKMSFPRTD